MLITFLWFINQVEAEIKLELSPILFSVHSFEKSSWRPASLSFLSSRPWIYNRNKSWWTFKLCSWCKYRKRSLGRRFKAIGFLLVSWAVKKQFKASRWIWDDEFEFSFKDQIVQFKISDKKLIITKAHVYIFYKERKCLDNPWHYSNPFF